jgi:Flp pilus assembly protein TadB
VAGATVTASSTSSTKANTLVLLTKVLPLLVIWLTLGVMLLVAGFGVSGGCILCGWVLPPRRKTRRGGK